MWCGGNDGEEVRDNTDLCGLVWTVSDITRPALKFSLSPGVGEGRGAGRMGGGRQASAVAQRRSQEYPSELDPQDLPIAWE